MSGRFARRFCLLALVTAACLGMPATMRAQALPAAIPGPPMLQGAAIGQTVVLSWSPVPGATNYIVGVGVASNTYLLVQSVGAGTTITVDAPPGLYFVRIAAQGAEGQPSNEVVIPVSPIAVPPPAAPANLQAHVVGQTAYLAWQLGQGGGPASGLVFSVGSTPGGTDLGFAAINVSTQTSSPVPPGTVFTRLHAIGPGGLSIASNEVAVAVGPPGCGVSTGPTLSANVSGSSVVLSWLPVPGVAGYRLDVSTTPGGPHLLSQVFGAGTNGVSASGVAAGQYYATVTAIAPCGTEATGPESLVAVTGQGGGRTPDPPPGQRLPLPNRLSVIQAVARQYPGDLRSSCREHGGNNTFLFRVVQRLRQEDSRWGLNWKRANRGDMSQDVINYHWGAGPDEDSTATYVVDIIAGHCGNSPGVTWNDVTGIGGAGARWTIEPYLRGGFTP